MPAPVYSHVARKRKFSTLSLRSAVENGSFSSGIKFPTFFKSTKYEIKYRTKICDFPQAQRSILVLVRQKLE